MTQINIQNNAPSYHHCKFITYFYPQHSFNARPVFQTEDIVTTWEDKEHTFESIIFTKKAKKEGKEAAIIEALQKSVQGRKDKTRAFVDELKSWQKEQYIDAHYNAKVMYDELAKLLPFSFGYEVFKKYYNNTI